MYYDVKRDLRKAVLLSLSALSLMKRCALKYLAKHTVHHRLSATVLCYCS